MTQLKKVFMSTLKKFDFGKHQAHRWLLLKRAQREEILREAGLLDIINLEEDPIHVGNIVRGDQEYDWGRVIFQGKIPQLGEDMPCSVYAGFEYLIRQCELFPSFISLADLLKSNKEKLDHLPVYASRFDLSSLEPASRNEAINKMLRLHDINRRNEPLVHKSYEVSDASLFEEYFSEYLRANK